MAVNFTNAFGQNFGRIPDATDLFGDKIKGGSYQPGYVPYLSSFGPGKAKHEAGQAEIRRKLGLPEPPTIEQIRKEAEEAARENKKKSQQWERDAKRQAEELQFSNRRELLDKQNRKKAMNEALFF